MIRRSPSSTLFPYTTLFRSQADSVASATAPFDDEVAFAWLRAGNDLNVGLGPRNSLEIFHALRSEEHTSELQSRRDLVCRLLLEKKKITDKDAEHTRDEKNY